MKQSDQAHHKKGGGQRVERNIHIPFQPHPTTDEEWRDWREKYKEQEANKPEIGDEEWFKEQPDYEALAAEMKIRGVGEDNWLSVVTLTWDKPKKNLMWLLRSLWQQTIPPIEVIVVDANTDEKLKGEVAQAVNEFPFAYRVWCPMDKFNMSKGFNYGIKRTAERAKYVLVTGVDMVFGANVIEAVLQRIHSNAAIFSMCGFLREKAEPNDDPHEGWKQLCAMINPNPPPDVSPGTMIAAPREWWFKAQGYDETHNPFAFADSDVWMRAKLDGMEEGFILWGVAQILHVWHNPSEWVSKAGGEFPNPKRGVIRNEHRWGEG